MWYNFLVNNHTTAPSRFNAASQGHFDPNTITPIQKKLCPVSSVQSSLSSFQYQCAVKVKGSNYQRSVGRGMTNSSSSSSSRLKQSANPLPRSNSSSSTSKARIKAGLSHFSVSFPVNLAGVMVKSDAVLMVLMVLTLLVRPLLIFFTGAGC